MAVNLKDRAHPTFIFDAPKIDFVPAPYTGEKLTSALQIAISLLDLTKPIMLEKTNQYLYFAVRDLKALEKLNPDMRQTTEFAKKDGVVVLCALNGETFDLSIHLHARGFAPLVGVPEDPFTGSMQGGLVAYAMTQGIVNSSLKFFISEQGHFIGRPESTMLEMVSHSPFHVRLHAEAVHVFESELTLN